jgi:protein-disulfide isomerase
MQLCFMTRSSVLAFGLAAFLSPVGFSQAAPPSQAPAASSQALPSAPPVNDVNPFPSPDPRNFTADSPSPETVNGFLKANWGFDPNRIWQVEDILKTPVAGVSKIVVFVMEKGQAKAQPTPLVFFSLPDGKHIIDEGALLPFGMKPFEQDRQVLASDTTGPSRGASSKDLEIVEFADFECPHCKEAQDTIDKLVKDYPTAHFVFQSYPLVEIHSEAFKAAAYGECVAKLSGDPAFFKFSDAIFADQAELTPQSSDQALKNAVTKAGGDPAKISACASSAETKAAVNASVDLGDKVGVEGTPWLFVNGRNLGSSFLSVPYQLLLTIIDYQAQQDGISLPPRPPAPPPAPTLQ